jgi:hypothetical protein
VTQLQEQLNEALREAAQARLALRMRAPSAPPSPAHLSPLTSPKPAALLSPKSHALLSPRELQGTPRAMYKQLLRAGKAAEEDSRPGEAVAHFRAAAQLASDPKLDRRIARLEAEL